MGDLTGQRFGRLTVIAPTDRRSKDRKILWQCKCDCGQMHECRGNSLTTGNTNSCGCLQIEIATAIVKKHGHFNTRTWISWNSMMQRCTDENHPSYPRYGGRGIAVCAGWRTSFENFLADMGERPAGKTLDRYPDPNGNYEPGNCRWATPAEQAQGRTSTKLENHEPAQVRWLKSIGQTTRDIASFFGISEAHARRIMAGDSWA